MVTEGAAGRMEFRAPWWSPPTVARSRVAKLAGIEAHVDENGRFTYYTYYRGVELQFGRQRPVLAHPPESRVRLPQRRRHDACSGSSCPRASCGLSRPTPWPLPPVLGRGAGRSDPRRRRTRSASCAAPPRCRTTGVPRRPPASPSSETRRWPSTRYGGPAAATPSRRRTGSSSRPRRPSATARTSSGRSTEVSRATAGIHRSRTRWHYMHIAGLSTVRDLYLAERLVFAAATRDAELATRVLIYLGRTVGPQHLATPSALCRTALVNLGALFSGRKDRETRSLSPKRRRSRCYAHAAGQGMSWSSAHIRRQRHHVDRIRRVRRDVHLAAGIADARAGTPGVRPGRRGGSGRHRRRPDGALGGLPCPGRESGDARGPAGIGAHRPRGLLAEYRDAHPRGGPGPDGAGPAVRRRRRPLDVSRVAQGGRVRGRTRRPRGDRCSACG